MLGQATPPGPGRPSILVAPFWGSQGNRPPARSASGGGGGGAAHMARGDRGAVRDPRRRRCPRRPARVGWAAPAGPTRSRARAGRTARTSRTCGSWRAYWRDGYDWRAQERLLNSLPQFKATVDDFGLHFVHLRGQGAGPAAHHRPPRLAGVVLRDVQDRGAAHRPRGARGRPRRRLPPRRSLAPRLWLLGAAARAGDERRAHRRRSFGS